MAIYAKDTDRQTGSTRNTDDCEIPSRIGGLELNISALKTTVDALVARLGPVLRAPAPEGDACSEAESSHTELGEQLQTLAGRVQHIDRQLTDALRRLEV